MKNKPKVWLEKIDPSQDGLTNQHHYGMSSGLGATKDDLPQDVPPGSDAFDYTTKKLYFNDGVRWD